VNSAFTATVQAAIQAVDDLLPQTQCTQCGYGGCLPYAQAIVTEDAPINRCPPGGAGGIAALAAQTGKAAIPLDPSCGQETPRHSIRIVGDLCIGCTKCIQACPVDAIVGAHRRMHAVVPELCTGCDLCIAPCPVDCIERIPLESDPHWTRDQAYAARNRLQRRTLRLHRVSLDQQERRDARLRHDLNQAEADERKRSVIAAALARARARRQVQG
jgi:electron transport complex protein RnfB